MSFRYVGRHTLNVSRDRRMVAHQIVHHRNLLAEQKLQIEILELRKELLDILYENSKDRLELKTSMARIQQRPSDSLREFAE